MFSKNFQKIFDLLNLEFKFKDQVQNIKNKQLVLQKCVFDVVMPTGLLVSTISSQWPLKCPRVGAAVVFQFKYRFLLAFQNVVDATWFDFNKILLTFGLVFVFKLARVSRSTCM